MPVKTEVIASAANRWLKQFRRALGESHPKDKDLIGLEGVRLIEEVLRSGVELAAVLVAPAGERHLTRLGQLLSQAAEPAPILRTSDRLFASVADTKHPQGIAALARPRMATLADALVGTTPLVVVLVGVQDPGNVGTILRSAEAFGATGVVTSSFAKLGTAHPFAPKVLRASAGSAFRLPVVQGPGAAVVLAQLKMAGLKVYATRAESSAEASAGSQVLSPSAADLTGPCALLIGNEGAGLPDESERSADALLRIPLAAPVESLNAGVAASVLLYEAARQRGRSA